jgi:phage-related minor tail protein
MDEASINSALDNLYKSLKNLESARTQVNKVSDKSELLIKEFSKVATELKEINEAIQLDKGEFQTKITSSIKSLNKNFNDSIKEISSSVISFKGDLEDHNTYYESHIKDSIGHINTFLEAFSEGVNKVQQIDFNEDVRRMESLLFNLNDLIEKNESEQDNRLKRIERTIKNQTKLIISLGLFATLLVVIVYQLVKG